MEKSRANRRRPSEPGPRHQSRQARHQSFTTTEARAQRAVSRPGPVVGAERLQVAGKVQTVSVFSADELGMRVDRFFSRCASRAEIQPHPAHHSQRRGASDFQVDAAQSFARGRAGPACCGPSAGAVPYDAPAAQKDRAFLKSIILFEDADVMVLNKPMGLAVQGGSGTTRHIDGMLGTLRGPHGQRPRLVHRLDKDTAGCLLVAKPALRRQRSQRLSARARRAKFTGRWLPAC